MVDCQIIRDGKVEGEVRQNGLTFIDTHGMERSNHIESDALEVSLKEWHYVFTKSTNNGCGFNTVLWYSG